MTSQFELSDDTPVYVISVAAQLSGMHPQTLRAYDRLGLVSPGRSAGRGRRYSLRDILILREIQRLSQEEGINLQGIKRILELELAEQRSRLLGWPSCRPRSASCAPSWNPPGPSPPGSRPCCAPAAVAARSCRSARPAATARPPKAGLAGDTMGSGQGSQMIDEGRPAAAAGHADPG